MQQPRCDGAQQSATDLPAVTGADHQGVSVLCLGYVMQAS
jgi:hypothetical protein